MGIIILTSLLLIIGIIWGIKSYWDVLPVVMVFIGIVFALGIIIASINLNRSFEKNISDYNALKELIENQRSENMSEFERVQIVKTIHENNRIINEHRMFHGNFWTGIWYSEKIGNLEYLK